MKKQAKSKSPQIVVKLSKDMSRKVSELAAVAHVTPESLVRHFAYGDIAQAFERCCGGGRDIDFIIPCLEYRSRKTAERVAEAATAFSLNGRQTVGYRYEVKDGEDGTSFTVRTSWEAVEAAALAVGVSVGLNP